MDDAWAEIEAIHQDGVPPFEFIFDAKDCELPNSVKSLQPYRLPDDELKELGEKVTRLRELFSAKAAAIKTYGDAYFHDQTYGHDGAQLLEERAKLLAQKELAKEEARQEPSERGVSHKYRRR